MSTLKIEKCANTLPMTLSANTLYFVKVGNGIDVYVSDSDGTTALPVNGGGSDLEPFLTLGVGHG